MLQILGRVLVSNSLSQQIISGTPTSISYDIENTDNADAHDPSNPSRITITHGYFNLIRIRAKHGFQFALATSYTLQLRKNGNIFVPSPITTSSSNADGSSATNINLISYWVPCTLNDFFEIFATQNSGAGLNVLAQGWLEAELAYN